LITDGRFSGGSHGFIIGHITPEAQEGGPIALVKDGDKIQIDATNGEINLLVPEEEMKKRREAWKMPPYKVSKGTLWKFIKNVMNLVDIRLPMLLWDVPLTNKELILYCAGG
jgi:dihydroxy-acid dehydratase